MSPKPTSEHRCAGTFQTPSMTTAWPRKRPLLSEVGWRLEATAADEPGNVASLGPEEGLAVPVDVEDFAHRAHLRSHTPSHLPLHLEGSRSPVTPHHACPPWEVPWTPPGQCARGVAHGLRPRPASPIL